MAKGVKDEMKKIAEGTERARGLKGLLGQFSSILTRAAAFSTVSYGYFKKKAFRILWVASTSCVLLFLPILIEVAREKTIIEQEKIIVADLKKQGYSDADLTRMGFSAMEPAVGLASTEISGTA